MTFFTQSSSILQAFHSLNIQPNEQQLQAIETLQQWSKAVTRPAWMNVFNHQTGIYLWGEPGRGKTVMMDCLYQSLQVSKVRIHYHEFLQQIHQRLAQEHINSLEQLPKVVRDWFKDIRLICFDEFYMHDVADGVLMGRFLKIAVEMGIKVVLTSNYNPLELLPQQKCHKHIMGVIELLQQRFKQIHIGGSIDYRYHKLVLKPKYYTPLNEKTATELCDIFFKHDPHATLKAGQIHLCGRLTQIIGQGSIALWMDFYELCMTYRSHLDYLDIAQRWSVVVLSNIRKVDLMRADALQRFIWFVDILYDKQIALVLSSEEPIDTMLASCTFEMGKDLSRTQSRLAQMLSHH